MSDEMPPWLEEFAVHVRNQTLDVVVQTLREGEQRWSEPLLGSLAAVLEDAKKTPPDEWWGRARTLEAPLS